jgi:hypothetical protein
MRLDDMDAKLTAVQSSLQETIKETIRQSMATQNRHLRDIESQLETADARYNALGDTIKDALRQVMATPGRHIREIETRLEEVDTKLNALQEEPARTPEPTAQASNPKPETKSAQAADKKKQEAK